MCVTFCAHYTRSKSVRIIASPINGIVHSIKSRMFMRLSESMSAGMQTTELSASIVVVVVARVCTRTRFDRFV